jgi:predicted phage-related endonuclease
MVGKLTPDDIVTASTVPVVLGRSPYQTPNEKLRDAIASLEGNPPERIPQNQNMFWGDVLEPVILTEACNRLPVSQTDFNIDHAIWHSDLPLAASLDGMCVGSGAVVKADPAKGIYTPNSRKGVTLSGLGALEAKNTSLAPEDEPADHRGPWQLQAQLMCSGFSWGAVCVLYRGSDLRIFLYEADDAMQREIKDAVHDFERRKRDIDWYPALTSDDANVAWAKVDDGAMPLDLDKIDDADHWASVLINGKAEIKAIEAEIDIAEAHLKEMLGNHEEGEVNVDGGRYFIKWPMRKTRAQPAKTVAAKPESVVRQKTLTVKKVSK